MKHTFLLIALLPLFSGCAHVAHLYPSNDLAMNDGVLQMKYTAYGTGSGPVELVSNDGEVYQGEFSIVRGGSTNFGSIFAQVKANDGSAAYGYGNAINIQTQNASPGVVSAFSNRKRSIQCEFYNDNLSGHGYGGCKRSDGALYRLQY